MKKLCGYDLNGWRDLGCRNWVIRPDGDEEEVPSSVSYGGVAGVLVRIGEGRSAQLVGGAQAMLAPHGLGDGWGTIGKAENRMRITDVLSNMTPSAEALSAALNGLLPGAGFGVASIDDVPDASEILQERMLQALRKARVSSPLLVWRPVLAALYAIEGGLIDRRLKMCVICHSTHGLAVQILQIRLDSDSSEAILAPERNQPGRMLASECGYQGLWALATSSIGQGDAGRAQSSLEWTKAPGKLALGLPANPELLRLDNGDWQTLIPPPSLQLDDLKLPEGLAETTKGCDLVLFETLTEGPVRARLTSELRHIVGEQLVVLPVEAVAEGALNAARRLSKQQPVYFDFLPQISTIVQTRQGAESYDLVDPKATLRAGQLYRSPKPAHFAIQAGQERFSVFIRKQMADRPRKAAVPIGGKLAMQTPLDVWVEQSPASGRAKILLYSESLARQFQVDWDAAEELPQTWEDLLASFEKPAPTIPSRLILPYGMDVWLDNARGDGLLKIIAAQASREDVDWKLLADKFSARPFGRYALSSDGEFPPEVGQETRVALHHLIERAIQHVRDRLDGKVKGRNDSLRFLTWLYRLCPPEVSVWLLEAWDQQVRGHRLMTHVSHWKLAYQGLGRIVSKGTHEHAAIHKILQKPVSDWSWQRETAAMAFMLSRSDTAPKALSRKDVDRVARRILIEFGDNQGTSYNRFQYAPFLLVGLLRWRLVDPFALVSGQDPVADKLMRSVDDTIKDLGAPSRAKAKAKYAHMLEQVREELEGKGTNPDLLLDIARGQDDDEED